MVWTVTFIMKFFRRLLAIGAIFGLMLCYLDLRSDLSALQNELVRLHVVGASDSEEDQAVKLSVRDAVTEYLAPLMASVPDAASAEALLRRELPTITQRANEILQKAGCALKALVTVEEEQFPAREYDTFRLPAGTYKTLRIIIGPGQGHNWWCVLFPGLCIPATSRDFREAANMSGMPDSLSRTLTARSGPYELRFYCLDLLGRIISDKGA